MSAWMFLGIAILFEVFGTVLLKLSDGFEKIGYAWRQLPVTRFVSGF